MKYNLKKRLKNTHLTKNKVDASTPGHPQPSSTILFHIFLLVGSQEKIKKMSPQASKHVIPITFMTS